MSDFYGLEFVSRPLVPSLAALVVNGFPATSFRRVVRNKTTNRRKLSSWPTHSSGASSAALHVNRSSFKSTKSSDLRSKEYSYDQLKEFDEDGGPPRWFSPVECGCRSTGSPLLLFLPGIDGVGHGLQLQYKRLGEIFDIWCLHVPISDRTPFPDLVKLVQSTIRSEHGRVAKTPIYLVGESFGASLALVVAAQNPDIDLLLILANPAASLSKSLLQNVVPLWDMIDKHLNVGQFRGIIPVLPVEFFLWKLRMIHEMQSYLDSHFHAVEAPTLILHSGKDMLLSNKTECERLTRMLKRCEVRSYIDNRDPLFLDETFDLVTAIKRVSYYRRGASVDYVSDFLPPSPSDVKMMVESVRNSLEGPVLLVGNHIMMVFDAALLVPSFLTDENIMVRAMAHPLFFERLKKGGKLPDLSLFDVLRLSGVVPVSATNLYKALSMKSHVLLYPGGIREVFHQKGEEHKLFWPAEPEFVRMAARFGAKIIPFGAVGEDDVVQVSVSVIRDLPFNSRVNYAYLTYRPPRFGLVKQPKPLLSFS